MLDLELASMVTSSGLIWAWCWRVLPALMGELVTQVNTPRPHCGRALADWRKTNADLATKLTLLTAAAEAFALLAITSRA